MDFRGASVGAFGNFDLGAAGDCSSRWCRNRGGRSRSIGSGLRHTIDMDNPWIPVTKLGRLVKDGKITTFEEIYCRSIPILEYQIVDCLLPNLKEQVLKIVPVQKETNSGLRTRFRAFVAIGDENGHVGLGMQCAKRVSTAIKHAIYRAKTAVVPVRRGFWGSKHGRPHTIPCQMMVTFYGVKIALYPAPRGAGICGPPSIQKLLKLGGIQDCFTSVAGDTTFGPVVKATFLAIQRFFTFDLRNEEEKSGDDVHQKMKSANT